MHLVFKTILFLRNALSHDYDLKSVDTIILTFLASHQGHNTFAMISQTTLANECRIKPRYLKTRLAYLQKINLIIISKAGRCNSYTLSIPDIQSKNQPESNTNMGGIEPLFDKKNMLCNAPIDQSKSDIGTIEPQSINNRGTISTLSSTQTEKQLTNRGAIEPLLQQKVIHRQENRCTTEPLLTTKTDHKLTNRGTEGGQIGALHDTLKDKALKTKTKAKAKSAAEEVAQRDRQPRSDDVAPVSPLFSFLPPKLWQSFVELRQEIKAPLSKQAEVLLHEKLIKYHNEGHDVVEIVKATLINRWKDFFLPKQPSAGTAASRAARTTPANELRSTVPDYVPQPKLTDEQLAKSTDVKTKHMSEILKMLGVRR
jgi:hypothetical protein